MRLTGLNSRRYNPTVRNDQCNEMADKTLPFHKIADVRGESCIVEIH